MTGLASGLTLTAISLHSVGVTKGSNWTFMRAEVDRTLVGWGEVTLRSHETIMEAVLDQLRPQMVGKKVPQLADFRKAHASLPSGRAGNAVFSGMDQALADVEGQTSGRPLHALLGDGACAPLEGYATVNRSIRERTASGFAEGASRAVRAGFRGVKVMPFDRVLPGTADTDEGRAEMRRALERLEAVRDAVGPGVSLMADCHWRLSERAAKSFIADVASLRLHWIECPLPESGGWHDAIVGLRREANRRGTLLAGAENLVGLAGFAPFLARGMYDVIMPDVKYCGGHRELAAICNAATAADVLVSLHNPSGPIAHAHTVHACAALDLGGGVEQQFGEPPLWDACVSGEVPRPENGQFKASDLPGLGARVNDCVLAQNPSRPFTLGLADPSYT